MYVVRGKKSHSGVSPDGLGRSGRTTAGEFQAQSHSIRVVDTGAVFWVSSRANQVERSIKPLKKPQTRDW